MKTLIALATALVLAGCMPPSREKFCHLLAIAYAEQDELAGPWYVEAAPALKWCGYPEGVLQDAHKRGRDADGLYNGLKED